MNAAEVLQLCRLVKAVCPAQAMDEFTPDAWSLILGGLSYTDAKAAVAAIASAPLEPGKARYIEPGHIIAGVNRIRAKRLEANPMPTPPAGLDGAAYMDWHRATREAIASGGYVPDTPPLVLERGFDWRAVMPVLSSTTLTAKTPESRPEIRDEDAGQERARQIAALEDRIAGADS